MQAQVVELQLYDIQELSYETVNKHQPSKDVDARLKASAYENGAIYETVLGVIAIVLRDHLLELQSTHQR